jgi:glycosyltransferase involved in cell wall biosynthesis
VKIALYYPWLYLRSGAERAICELMKRSRHEITAFTNHYDAEQTYPEFRDLRVVPVNRISVERNIGAVLRGSATVVTQKLPLDGFDALIVISDGVGDLVTLRNHERPVVCILSTPLRIVFDPVYRAEYMKAQSNPVLRGTISLFGSAFVWIDRWAWRYYRRILCNSPETYNRALRGKLAEANRLEVLPPGIDYEAMQPDGNFGDYFLLPGRIKWTKNVELGLQSFLRLCEKAGSGFRLVVAGQVDTKSHGYFSKLREMAKNHPRIEFQINPSDAVLFELYRHAYAVLMTSLNEDWGMVPLEGMAFGKPVLAVAQGGPLYSVVEGETGYLLAPTPEAFSDAMIKLATSRALVERLGRQARKHVARFDWSQYVNRVDQVLVTL